MEANYLYKSIPGQSPRGFLQVIGVYRIFLEEMIVCHKTKALGHLTVRS